MTFDLRHSAPKELQAANERGGVCQEVSAEYLLVGFYNLVSIPGLKKVKGKQIMI